MTPAAIADLLAAVGLPSGNIVMVGEQVAEADVYPAGAWRVLKSGAHKPTPLWYGGVCGRLKRAGVVLMRTEVDADVWKMHIVFRVEETGE